MTTMKKPRKACSLRAEKFAAFFAVLIAAAMGGASAAAAQTETVLYNFQGSTGDGANPQAGVIIDSSGNLYGATLFGGQYGQGTVFEFPSGATSDMILCNLPGGNGTPSMNGAIPAGTPALDSSGNLYGTAGYDTYSSTTGGSGKGVVYECMKGSSGYTYSVLHQFNGYSGGVNDGANPFASLCIAAANPAVPGCNPPGVAVTSLTLYGTTYQNGNSYYGTVFKLVPNGTGGTKSYLVAHPFAGGSSDGAHPYGYGGVILDSSSNIYGTTTQAGSASDNGVVFKLVLGSGGAYNSPPTLLSNFPNAASYGAEPFASVISDSSGNLYGTTFVGGAHGYGVVFELTPNGSGGYSYTNLHSFAGGSTDGEFPEADLAFDSAGNLYGTTTSGGQYGYGIVYELTPNGSGGYNYVSPPLHSFAGGTGDGATPDAALTFDSTTGNLYGTTVDGGQYGYGVIFKIALSTAGTRKGTAKP